MAFLSGLFWNISVLSIYDLNPAFSELIRVFVGRNDFWFDVLGLTIDCPELIFHLLSYDLKLNRIIKYQVAKFGSNEESGKNYEIITSERLSIESSDLILNR